MGFAWIVTWKQGCVREFMHCLRESSVELEADQVGGDMLTWVSLTSFSGRFFAFTGTRSIASKVESAPSMTCQAMGKVPHDQALVGFDV